MTDAHWISLDEQITEIIRARTVEVVRAAVLAEREACAKLLDEMAGIEREEGFQLMRAGLHKQVAVDREAAISAAAAAIRARKDEL